MKNGKEVGGKDRERKSGGRGEGKDYTARLIQLLHHTGTGPVHAQS